MTTIVQRAAARLRLRIEFAALLRSLYGFAWMAYSRYRTQRALDRLDDRQLKDIGLSRSYFGYELLDGDSGDSRCPPPHRGRRP